MTRSVVTLNFAKAPLPVRCRSKVKKLWWTQPTGPHMLPRPRYSKLGAEVISIGCQPDGLNINQGVGATQPTALVDAVKEHHADFGIALDGDADRLQVVDHTGRLFNGDELLYVLAKDRLQQGQTLSGVVGTQMTNKGVELALAQWNVPLVRAKVGDRYVLEKLLENQWLLGGEGSGHLLILDKHSSGDGLISGLQVLQACLRANTSLAQALSDVQLCAQHMVNIRLREGLDWQHHVPFQQACLALEKKLGDQGRILIRPSGTEPVLRIMVEALDRHTAQTSAEQLSLLLN